MPYYRLLTGLPSWVLGCCNLQTQFAENGNCPPGEPAGSPELRPGDIPTSAVDFHVSDIAVALLTCPSIAEAAAAAAAAAPGADAEERLRRAMWRVPCPTS